MVNQEEQNIKTEKQSFPLGLLLLTLVLVGGKKAKNWIEGKAEDIEKKLKELPDYLYEAAKRALKSMKTSVGDFFYALGGETDIDIIVNTKEIVLKVKGKVISKIPLPEEKDPLTLLGTENGKDGKPVAIKLSYKNAVSTETGILVQDILYLLAYYAEIVAIEKSLVPKAVVTVNITCANPYNRFVQFLFFFYFNWIINAFSSENPIKLRMKENCNWTFQKQNKEELTVWLSKVPNFSPSGLELLPQEKEKSGLDKLQIWNPQEA